MKRALKALGIGLVVLIAVVAGMVLYAQAAWDAVRVEDVRALVAPSDPATVARGQFIFRDALACWTCHSGDTETPNPGADVSGGREFDMRDVGPGFGMVWAPNITSDVETGIGAWSDGELARTLREGVGRDGRLLFPIMESETYQRLSDEDVLALIAYLRTLPPVKKPSKRFQPSWFAKVLMTWVMKPMQHTTEPVLAPTPGETPEYGQYLAWSLGGCGGCHTPRSQNDGQWDMTRPFGGGTFTIEEPTFGWSGSNLTPSKSGLGSWSEAQFMTLMRTGARPDGRVVVPAIMPWPSTAKWSDRDLKAVWTYLRTLKPVEHDVLPTRLARKAKDATGTERGKAIYATYCVTCHGREGAGTPYTTVVQRTVARKLDDATTTALLVNGLGVMPGFGKTLDAGQLADVLAYLRTFAPFEPGGADAAAVMPTPAPSSPEPAGEAPAAGAAGSAGTN